MWGSGRETCKFGKYWWGHDQNISNIRANMLFRGWFAHPPPIPSEILKSMREGVETKICGRETTLVGRGNDFLRLVCTHTHTHTISHTHEIFKSMLMGETTICGTETILVVGGCVRVGVRVVGGGANMGRDECGVGRLCKPTKFSLDLSPRIGSSWEDIHPPTRQNDVISVITE